MNEQEIIQIIFLSVFAITVILSIFLVKRAKPEKRFYWFVGSSIVTIGLLGIIKGPVAVGATIVALALAKKENDRPLADIGTGLLGVFASGLGLAFYALYLLVGIGGLYWLWLAIQLKSFGMFVIGIVPLTWLVSAPVGAYALIFGTPQWVINIFG